MSFHIFKLKAKNELTSAIMVHLGEADIATSTHMVLMTGYIKAASDEHMLNLENAENLIRKQTKAYLKVLP